MRTNFNLEYCEAKGCTTGVQPGTRLCHVHEREAQDEALRAESILTTKSGTVICEACGAPRRPNKPCASCDEAREQLERNLNLDPDDVFG